MNKHDQSTIRLLSIAALAAGLLLLRGAAPAVTPALAAGPDLPQSNPYADWTQCLYRAWDLAAEAGHVLPWFPGNAQDWRQGAIDHGLTVVDTIGPNVVNSVAIWGGGVGGASWAGHVGWVTAVEDDRFYVLERNWIPATDGERWVSWVPGISFIVFDAPQPESPAPEAATAEPTEPPPTPTAEPTTPPPTVEPTAAPAAPLAELRVAPSSRGAAGSRARRQPDAALPAGRVLWGTAGAKVVQPFTVLGLLAGPLGFQGRAWLPTTAAAQPRPEPVVVLDPNAWPGR